MESLVLPNRWALNMKDESNLILTGQTQQIDNWRLVTYPQSRESTELKCNHPKTSKVDGHNPWGETQGRQNRGND